jgi:leucyl/phenylalanyl-tRNA---protein transferase
VSDALVEPNGLLAVGGDLRPARLLEAYSCGIFPWYEEGQPILWWSPDPRMCLRPEQVIISGSMHKLIRKQQFQVTMDRAFPDVIRLCGQLRAIEPGTWISPAMQSAYCELHRLGYAHSVEVWRDDKLVGGLYGLALGQMFFGESMFSLESNASKMAFIYLCRQLQNWNFQLIDCQLPTAHLSSLGAEAMSRAEFQRHLQTYQDKGEKLGLWSMERDLLP